MILYTVGLDLQNLYFLCSRCNDVCKSSDTAFQNFESQDVTQKGQGKKMSHRNFLSVTQNYKLGVD